MPSRTPRIDQPVTLRHIRGHGCRCVLVYCSNLFRCGHSATLNVDALPDDTIVRALGARMACTSCGHIGRRSGRIGPHTPIEMDLAEVRRKR